MQEIAKLKTKLKNFIESFTTQAKRKKATLYLQWLIHINKFMTVTQPALRITLFVVNI